MTTTQLIIGLVANAFGIIVSAKGAQNEMRAGNIKTARFMGAGFLAFTNFFVTFFQQLIA